MLDIIVLFFLCRHIGAIARKKGLKAAQWIWYTIFAWIAFEFVGIAIGIMLFGFNQKDLFGLMLFAIACAFGGYLFIKARLDKTPDAIDDDINNIGTN